MKDATCVTLQFLGFVILASGLWYTSTFPGATGVFHPAAHFVFYGSGTRFDFVDTHELTRSSHRISESIGNHSLEIVYTSTMDAANLVTTSTKPISDLLVVLSHLPKTSLHSSTASKKFTRLISTGSDGDEINPGCVIPRKRGGPTNQKFGMLGALYFAIKFNTHVHLNSIDPHFAAEADNFKLPIDEVFDLSQPFMRNRRSQCTEWTRECWSDCHEVVQQNVGGVTKIRSKDVCKFIREHNRKCLDFQRVVPPSIFRRDLPDLHDTYLMTRNVTCLHFRFPDDLVSDMRRNPALFLTRRILSLFDGRMFPESGWKSTLGKFIVSPKMTEMYRVVTLQHVIGNIIRNAKTDLYVMSNVNMAFMFKDGPNRKVYDVSNFTNTSRMYLGHEQAHRDQLICAKAQFYMRSRTSFSDWVNYLRGKPPNGPMWQFFSTNDYISRYLLQGTVLNSSSILTPRQF